MPKPNQSSFACVSSFVSLTKTLMPAKSERADRYVDIEHPAPADIFCQPAADDGAEYGADHDRNSEQGHGRSALFGRIDVEQDALRQGNERCAEQALQQPEADDLRQRLRKTAQNGSRHEADDRY